MCFGMAMSQLDDRCNKSFRPASLFIKFEWLSRGTSLLAFTKMWVFYSKLLVQYHFEGRYDIVKFVKLVGSSGLYLHLRIGPYVCAEWNFGYYIFLHFISTILLLDLFLFTKLEHILSEAVKDQFIILQDWTLFKCFNVSLHYLLGALDINHCMISVYCA